MPDPSMSAEAALRAGAAAGSPNGMFEHQSTVLPPPCYPQIFARSRGAGALPLDPTKGSRPLNPSLRVPTKGGLERQRVLRQGPETDGLEKMETDDCKGEPLPGCRGGAPALPP